jgi:serine/threonine-protein kinase
LRDLVQKCLLVAESGSYHYPMRAWASFVGSQGLPAAATRQTNQLTGTQLGPYQVLEQIGRGGMAEVYKGHHPRLDRTVAIKILPARLSSEAGAGPGVFAGRFEREARAVAALRHPNIVQIFDFGDIEGTYYMVMEYIRGRDLSALVRDQAPFSLALTRSLIEQLASALDYAHAQALVHRDVKPSNVLLEQDSDEANGIKYQPDHYRVVLTDFGIAKILGGDTAATQTGILMGTLDYIAPEQIRSAGNVDHRADIYALGIMLFQMLTGQLPFKNDNPGMVMMAHLQTPPPDPRQLRPDLPEPLALAVLQALAKNPDERFGSAGELARIFSNL